MVVYGFRGGTEGEILDKEYKPSILGCVSSEDLMYRMATIVNTVFYS